MRIWKTPLVVVTSLLLGFAAGFVLANAVNKNEREHLRAELSRLRAAAGGAGDDAQAGAGGGEDLSIPTLTDEQLRGAVAKADADPADGPLQRTTGQNLYLYAMHKGNAAVLPDVARILARAHDADPKDAALAVLAGNAHFLVARAGGDLDQLRRARAYYERALASKPDDTGARTSLGLTYFFDRPSDPRRAAREYRRALETDPRAEPPLQALVAALAAAGEFDEAGRRLAELSAVNPDNPEIPNLRARLEQQRNAAKETQ